MRNDKTAPQPEEFDWQEFLADESPRPSKSLNQLMQEGLISARQYRSMLFLMSSGPSFTTDPDFPKDIEAEIRRLNAIIEEEDALGARLVRRSTQDGSD